MAASCLRGPAISCKQELIQRLKKTNWSDKYIEWWDNNCAKQNTEFNNLVLGKGGRDSSEGRLTNWIWATTVAKLAKQPAVVSISLK